MSASAVGRWVAAGATEHDFHIVAPLDASERNSQRGDPRIHSENRRRTIRCDLV